MLKITSGSAVTLKLVDKILTQRGKLQIFQCPFYSNNLEYLQALWQAKGNIFPQSKLGPFSWGAEGSFCPLCQDHSHMKGDGNGNTKYSPLFSSPAATNLHQHQCREKVLSKVGVREEEENSVFAMSQSFPSHPPSPTPLPISMASLKQHKEGSGGFVWFGGKLRSTLSSLWLVWGRTIQVVMPRLSFNEDFSPKPYLKINNLDGLFRLCQCQWKQTGYFSPWKQVGKRWNPGNPGGTHFSLSRRTVDS